MQQDNLFLRIRNLWEELERSFPNGESNPDHRIYRRLDLKRETGIRLGCVSPKTTWEMLVEAGAPGEIFTIEFPKWKGMQFDTLNLDVPKPSTCHIRLFLEHIEYRDIFITVCTDLVRSLDGCITHESRRNEVNNFLNRWSRFFDRYGSEGLLPEYQRGLYGELWWLRRMIQAGMDSTVSVKSWKGCEQNYHDFEVNGHVVEVKTTMTKEPRRIQISNERQLDDRGSNSLHLFVITIMKHENGGESLPDIVQSLRTILSERSSIYTFEHSLRAAGYLDVHAHLYTSTYTIIKEELFNVGEGFPRIINAPQGVGDLRYSIVVAACGSFICDIPEYFETIKERLHAE